MADTGPPDTGPLDSGLPCAGPPGSRLPDTGLSDTGPSDTGLPDSGPPDTGPSDTGLPDSGPPDSGPPDTGLSGTGPPGPGAQPLPHRERVMVQERLRDQIAKALRAALSSGELEPGALYSAPVLAARYGVSATPVREAMLDLVREGLVEPVRNKGFRVTEPSGRDLAEFAEVRALVEVPIAGLVARTATAAQLGALRPPAEEAVAAAERGDAAGCREASRRFHAALLGLSGNRRLVEVAADLGRRSSPPGAPGPEDLAAAARDHLDLLDLLAAGDAAGAERCMRRHLDRLRGAGLPAPRRGRPAGRSGTPGVQNVSRQLSM